MALNYEMDIRIQEDALDIEWLEQPSLMMKYSRNAAAMRRDMDEASEELNMVKASLDNAIRKNPEKYDIAKITVASVEAAITLSEKYQESLALYNDARYEYDVAKAAVEALHQKKAALENLVRLNGQSYFAGPSVPRELTKEWEAREKAKTADKKVAAKMQRRNK